MGREKEGMKKLLKVLVPFCLLAGLLVMPGAPVGAIQNGTADNNGHPFVCVVVFYKYHSTPDPVYGNYEPLWRTSGELISSRVVLTAGHGTIGTDFATVWFSNYIEPNKQPPNQDVKKYPYYGGQDGYTGIPDTPAFYKSVPTPGLPGFDYHDVGVVVLDQAVPASVVSEYGQLPAVGQVDSLKMMAPVDLVGYGVTSQTRGGGVSPYLSWDWNRQRNFAPGAFIASKDLLASEFMKLTANPGNGKGGTTFGDSGGPILLGGTSTILAINSFVNNSNCDGVTYAQRIDLPDILAWINGFID